MSGISGAYQTVRNNFTSESPVNRGVATGATGAVVAGGTTGIFMLGQTLRHGSAGSLPPVATTARAAVTGLVGFGTIGALSNVKLSSDRYVAGFQGAALGAGVGGAGTAIMTSVWSAELLKTPSKFAGAAGLGAAIGGAIYAGIGLSGAVAQDG